MKTLLKLSSMSVLLLACFIAHAEEGELQYAPDSGEESEPVITLVDDAPLAPADADGDGVSDDQDKCPGSAPAVAVDAYGCEEIRFAHIQFDTESAALDATATRKLGEVAAILMRNPDAEIDIAGHADSRGPENYNMRLSVNRAESVRGYLAQQGVDASRMTVRGLGESRPVASNETASGQAQNRRVELRAMGR